MQRLMTMLAILVLGALLTIVVACQDDVSKSQSAAPQPEQSQMAQQATEAAKEVAPQLASKNVEIVGMVARTADGIMITTDEGDFAVTPHPMVQNLDELVGKRVKVTATLLEGLEKQAGSQVIDIIALTEIE